MKFLERKDKLVAKNKLIAISLAPNLTKKDVLIALKYLFIPFYWFLWQKGDKLAELKQKFLALGFNFYIYFFNSARSGFYCLLQALNIKPEDEIIIQPYTCMVVANIIKFFKAKPVYVDITASDFNIDVSKIKEKITSKTKAIVLQHTFGIPANIEIIKNIVKEYNLVLIEDCAVSLGAYYNNKLIGTFGDASFFSFGRDKIISTVTGGCVIINNERINANFVRLYEKVPKMKRWEIFQSLFHIIIMPLVLYAYNFLSLGKLILFIFQKIKFLNKAYTKKELKLNKPNNIPTKYCNCLAEIAINQINNLAYFNKKRKEITLKYYDKLTSMARLGKISTNSQEINTNNLEIILPRQELLKNSVFLRFPILVENPEYYLQKAKNENIILGDWYREVIMPIQINALLLDYQSNSCPVAEAIAKKSLNLPTYYKLKEEDIERIVNLFK